MSIPRVTLNMFLMYVFFCDLGNAFQSQDVTPSTLSTLQVDVNSFTNWMDFASKHLRRRHHEKPILRVLHANDSKEASQQQMLAGVLQTF